MKTFYLGKNGPSPCHAKSPESCPLGSTHFSTLQEAELAFSQTQNTFEPAKKIKVVEVAADPFDLVEDPPIVKSGTLLRAKDGTFLIASNNSTFKEYGIYMIGNLSNEPSVAAKLHSLDRDKIFQEGSCDDLSFSLLKKNPNIVAVDELVNAQGVLWHSFARHRDGYYLDSLGKWTPQDLFDYWETISDLEEEELTLVKNADETEEGQRRKTALQRRAAIRSSANLSSDKKLNRMVSYLSSL